MTSAYDALVQAVKRQPKALLLQHSSLVLVTAASCAIVRYRCNRLVSLELTAMRRLTYLINVLIRQSSGNVRQHTLAQS